MIGSVPGLMGRDRAEGEQDRRPACAARLQVSAFQPPESPLKLGRFATRQEWPRGCDCAGVGAGEALVRLTAVPRDLDVAEVPRCAGVLFEVPACVERQARARASRNSNGAHDRFVAVVARAEYRAGHGAPGGFGSTLQSCGRGVCVAAPLNCSEPMSLTPIGRRHGAGCSRNRSAEHRRRERVRVVPVDRRVQGRRWYCDLRPPCRFLLLSSRPSMATIAASCGRCPASHAGNRPDRGRRPDRAARWRPRGAGGS